MEFRRIEYFLVLAEKLNYAKAAKELFISSQALTKQIFILEEELGAKLFDRTTRSVKLTEMGEICKTKFGQVKEEFDKAIDSVEVIISSTRKIVKIGFFAALPKNEIIMHVVNSIKTVMPDLEIEMFAGGMDQIKTMLDEDKIDIGITNAHDFEDWMGYDRVNLAAMPAQIVVSSKHIWADKKEITEEDMENASILLLEKKRPLEFNSFYKNIKVGKKYYAQDFDSMLTILEMGRDFGVFPKVFNDMYKAELVYFDLPPKMKFFYRTMCACKTDNPKKEIKAIMNIIRDSKDDYKL